jgi:DNA-binding NtrC family response regulator
MLNPIAMPQLLADKSVIIVEDEMLIAMNVEQVAHDLGAHDVQVLRVRDALRHMLENVVSPDICIVDYRSANGERRDVAEFFSSSAGKLIVMTTDGDPDKDPLVANADAMLRKPFGNEEIAQAFRDALGARSNNT